MGGWSAGKGALTVSGSERRRLGREEGGVAQGDDSEEGNCRWVLA